MRLPVWVLVWCPDKQRLGHRHAQSDSYVRMQGEDGHLHTKEGPSEESALLTP